MDTLRRRRSSPLSQSALVRVLTIAKWGSRRPHSPVWGLLSVLAVALAACTPSAHESPRLVVAVVVDQLQADLLERYDSLYTGGLRRLLDEGRRFPAAVHDHAHTETAAGHATLATGVLPSTHGIVANNWFEERTPGVWSPVYAVEDPASPVLGAPELDGRSPANLRSSGLADWIQAQTGGDVVSVSRKDRAAITMAGQSRGDVYWLELAGGRFVTSRYYGAEPASWVEAFNAGELSAFYADTIWTETRPELGRAFARRDTAVYEGDGTHTAFPHRFAEEGRGEDETAHNLWIAGTPNVDAATLALARAAIDTLGLGADTLVDYLSVALSQTDIIGHSYGPYSREQLDNLLRLDRELGAFLEFLDERVGEGRWVLGLSADHGVPPIPEYLQEIGIEAGRLSSAETSAVQEAIQSAPEDPDARAEVLLRALESQPSIADAMLRSDHARAGEPADSFARLFRHSYYEGRSPGPLAAEGIELRLREHYLASSNGTGTTHGSPYLYDRRVPLIFLGAGVEPGISTAPARTVDFAPTLARLSGIVVPEGLDGRALLDVSR